MDRRDFIKCTMGTLGSAMGISTVKADVLQGVSGEMPKPPVEIDWDCAAKGTEGTVVEIIRFDNLINSKTQLPLRMKRTESGLEIA